MVSVNNYNNAAITWNSLPSDVQSYPSLLIFRQHFFSANPFLIYYYSTVFLYFYALSWTLKSQ